MVVCVVVGVCMCVWVRAGVCACARVGVGVGVGVGLGVGLGVGSCFCLLFFFLHFLDFCFLGFLSFCSVSTMMPGILGLSMIEGSSTRGASSPANSVLHVPLPLSATTTENSSSAIVGKCEQGGKQSINQKCF